MSIHTCRSFHAARAAREVHALGTQLRHAQCASQAPGGFFFRGGELGSGVRFERIRVTSDLSGTTGGGMKKNCIKL